MLCCAFHKEVNINSLVNYRLLSVHLNLMVCEQGKFYLDRR